MTTSLRHITPDPQFFKSENDMSSVCRVFTRVALFACALLGSAAATAQSVQVLDSIDAFGPATLKPPSAVLEMGFRDPVPANNTVPPRFEQLPVTTSTIIACQRGLDQALYCLDGPLVRYWPATRDLGLASNGAQLVPDYDIIDCRDKALGLDTKRPNPCTSITVDYNGAIWLAGRKANSHSMIKVIRRTASSCPANWSALTPPQSQPAPNPATAQPSFCARELTPGRPVLVDINPIDGEVAKGFKNVAGILGLEERKTVAFFPDSNQPVSAVPLGSGKTDWALIGNEQLLSAALLQFEGDVKIRNFVLVTTTTGRVMARDVDAAGAIAFPVFQFTSARCSTTGIDQFGVRVSSQSGRVYVSDKRCQRVYALERSTQCAVSTPGAEFCLVNAKETPPGAAERSVILSTASSSVAVSPEGISVAPGIGIDLNDCGFNADGTRKTCPLNANNTNGNNFVGAELSGVRLVDTGKSAMTVFQVRGIPDCRHWSDGPGCKSMDGNPVAGLIDTKGYLNITPLLPEEVQIQAGKSLGGTLPPLLVSPRYRGQNRNPGQDGQPDGQPYEPTIDLFFGVTEPGVQFRDTFTASFDVADLAGPEWGCERGLPVTSANPVPDLEWDVALTISERAATVGGPTGSVSGPGREHVSMLVNSGCINPSQVEGPRWSLYAYNLEMDDDDNGDAVYAKLVRSLSNDLWDAQRMTACAGIDGQANGAAPIADCGGLRTKFIAAEEKLNRCITSSTFPRQSEAVNNCQSFESQFSQYQSALDGITPNTANDPANRLGELKVRAKVLAFVFDYHFLPSIPPAGFTDCGSATDPTTECNARAPK